MVRRRAGPRADLDGRLITDFPIDAAFLDRVVGDALRLARAGR